VGVGNMLEDRSSTGQIVGGADLGWMHQCLDDGQPPGGGICATHYPSDNGSLYLEGPSLAEGG
jgi:hypothetical protein